MENIKDNLINKSIEAFILGIEIYNKPTIQYRVEGFAFFICNAWELLLKSQMIQQFGEDSIYFRDNPNRTLSLSVCIEKIFTNSKDPLRLNLEKIVELRDTSTHFIVQEYEMVYIPLFQACVLNYGEKLMKFHNIDITKIIPQNFLTLPITMTDLEDSEITAKYSPEVSNKILELKNSIDNLSIHNNDKFAININHHYFITKKEDKATSIIKLDNTCENDEIRIVKELQDPNNTHKYTAKSCIKIIKDTLMKSGIILKYNNEETLFNHFHFKILCNYYGIKENTTFCYIHTQYKTPQYCYSQQCINFIVTELSKDPDNILDNIKKRS